MRTAFVFILLMFPPVALAERLPLKSYTIADGLPNNVIGKIVRDTRGFLWFCTNEGLARFDGYSFTNYGTDQGLPHATVNDFLQTRKGEMWIATNGGLVLFNPRGAPASKVVYANQAVGAGSMFTVVVPNDPDRAARAVTTLFEDSAGTLWCGTMRRLYRLERNGLKLVPVDLGAKDTFILDMLEDHGGLWIGAFNGLYRLGAGGFEHYTKSEGLPDNTIQDLLKDHAGHLWAATRLGGFFRFDPEHAPGSPFVPEVYNTRNGLPTNWVFQLYETSNQKFWLATNTGLTEFHPEAKDPEQRFHSYSKQNGLSFQEITALEEDSSGNLWLGTNVTGAMKLERDGFRTYDEADGIATMNAIFSDHAGRVCFRAFVSSAGGKDRASTSAPARQQLGCYYDSQFHWYMPPALKADGWVFEQVTLQTHTGEWWIGTGSGLFRFAAAERLDQIGTAQPLAVYTARTGLASNQVYRLFEDSRGGVWISTIGEPNGLARWDPATNQIRDLSSTPGVPSLKENLAQSFGEDAAGNMWIGFSTGVARYSAGRFIFFTTDEGLPAGGVQYIYPDRRGRLWLGLLRNGLARVDAPSSARPAFVNYTTAQSLSSNSTQVITEDLQGRIYVGTGRGLDQLDPDTGHIKHFTTADGLPGGAMSAAFRDRDGTLWFGTQKGLARFVPAADQPSIPPPVSITGVQVAGSAQPVSAVGDGEVWLADLGANQNQIKIDFVGLSFAAGDMLRYQYRFEGADANWSAPSAERTVNLARLAPGRYRFLVRAVNSDGLVSQQPAMVVFRILPPIWQRWWFVLLAVAGLMFAAYALYRYRVARLLELERVRTRIASDLHDDIGSNLSLIAGLSEMLNAQLQSTNGQVAERLATIASVSRRSVDAMSDIVWAVNPKRDNALDLSHRMRRFASDALSVRNIEFHLDAANLDRGTRVDAATRREVFLIFKEGINNIARHSHCRRADARLRVERGAIVLTLADDGCGFKVDDGQAGHGLESMRQRARKLSGELQVVSNSETGTLISLKAPLAQPR